MVEHRVNKRMGMYISVLCINFKIGITVEFRIGIGSCVRIALST